jgi:hypothetical protein
VHRTLNDEQDPGSLKTLKLVLDQDEVFPIKNHIYVRRQRDRRRLRISYKLPLCSVAGSGNP